MVNGIEIFRKHFIDFKEQYTIIGGFACDLLMTDAGLDFRQTVDIDMVLTVEELTTEFANAFWEFIGQGGYQARQRSNGKPEFYRFVNPTNPAFPKMIELFSRPQSHVTDELFTIPPQFANPALPQGQPLSRLELHEQREIWLEPILSGYLWGQVAGL